MEPPKCLFSLRKRCLVVGKLLERGDERTQELLRAWGSDDWVKLYCAMCIKAMYAKAKFRAVSKYSVVNTL